MTVCVTCTEKVLHAHKYSCTVLIPLCKNNLNLPMCSSPSPSELGCLLLLFIVLSYSLLGCTALIFLFACFYGSRLCSPVINQISLGQSKGWFPFILLYKWKKYHWAGLLLLRINYTNIISELHQHMYCYTNIFSTKSWNRP